jgi:hypothetical protein
VLCVVISAVYIRAFARHDQLHTGVFRHDCLVATFPHHLHVILARHAGGAYPTSFTLGSDQYPSRGIYLQPRFTSTALSWEISIPFWLPLLFATAIPLWSAGRAWRRRRRTTAGRCSECGYDLRASPERCSECGAVVTADAHRSAV